MSDLLNFAVETARESGAIIEENKKRNHKMDWNTRTHFKTEVDEMVDKLIRQRIAENFPDHNIYSEEGENKNMNSRFTWVCDALDGTIPYTFGFNDHYSVSIGLCDGNRPIVGAINAPGRDELYYAEENGGAFCNSEPISVSLEQNVNRAPVQIDGGKETEAFKRSDLGYYVSEAMAKDGVLCVPNTVAAAVPIALTASGKMAGYVALSLEPWDMVAGVIIGREAGANITNLRGKEWTLDDPSIIMANPVLHGKLYDLLKDA
jgi:myo-inositol-1(or 4)-monophosphatase